MIAQTIGWCAASIALLCLVGLFAARVLWPASTGTHTKRDQPGRHRDDGQVHGGAGSPGHADELAALRVVMGRARRHRAEDGEMADLFAEHDRRDEVNG